MLAVLLAFRLWKQPGGQFRGLPRRYHRCGYIGSLISGACQGGFRRRRSGRSLALLTILARGFPVSLDQPREANFQSLLDQGYFAAANRGAIYGLFQRRPRGRRVSVAGYTSVLRIGTAPSFEIRESLTGGVSRESIELAHEGAGRGSSRRACARARWRRDRSGTSNLSRSNRLITRRRRASLATSRRESSNLSRSIQHTRRPTKITVWFSRGCDPKYEQLRSADHSPPKKLIRRPQLRAQS